jgi:hypothetical protein
MKKIALIIALGLVAATMFADGKTFQGKNAKTGEMSWSYSKYSEVRYRDLVADVESFATKFKAVFVTAQDNINVFCPAWFTREASGEETIMWLTPTRIVAIHALFDELTPNEQKAAEKEAKSKYKYLVFKYFDATDAQGILMEFATQVDASYGR